MKLYIIVVFSILSLFCFGCSETDAEYCNRVGLESFQKGYFDNAVYNFTRAIERNPNYGEAYFNRGKAQHMLNEMNNGCSDFQKAYVLGFAKAKEMMDEFCK